MAKGLPSVSADKSAMDNFHIPGEIRITHNGEQVSIGKLRKIFDKYIYWNNEILS